LRELPWKRVTGALVVVALLGTAGPAAAAPGDLDPSFSTDGKRVVQLPGGTYEYHYSVAVQRDGKTLLAGTLFARPSNSELFVIRLRRGGRLDRSFSGDGLRRINITPGHDFAHEVLVQPDGKILLAGAASCAPNCYNYFLAVRLLPDGRRDRSFGTAGVVRINFPYSLNEAAWSVALDSRDRIVLAGGVELYGHDMAVARLLPDGRLDRRFSGDGRAVVEDTGISVTAYAVDIDSGDGVVTAGNHFAAARFHSNGSKDESFGETGFVGLGEFIAEDVHVMKDGRIVSMGRTHDMQMAAMRLRPDGSPDALFGQGGVGGFPMDCACDSRGGLVHRGKVVLVGEAHYGEGDDEKFGFAVARLTGDGEPDASFGNDGMVVTTFPVYWAVATDVAIRSDGKIVVAGPYMEDRMVVVRYLWD
jgi:uncharacterized delta-60 repeat protein